MAGAAPTVTVCIPVYNREAYVGEAIASVLAQGFRDFELLLIDDGSTDGSSAVMQGHADARIRLVHNEGNRGLPFTRNRALALARGRYLALLDSDDVMAPRRLERQVAFLDRHPDIATVGGCVTRFSTHRRRLRRLVRPLEPEQLRAWLLFRSGHANTTLMGRIEILREFGYHEEFGVCEDYDLLVRLSRRHRMANLPRVLTYMREHEGRTTRCVPEQVHDAKRRLVETQLRILGMAATRQDMDRHLRLTRMQPADWQRWPDYLPWARAWLAGLLRANGDSRVYARPALAGVLGQVWVVTCVQAMAGADPVHGVGGLGQWAWVAQGAGSVWRNLAYATGLGR